MNTSQLALVLNLEALIKQFLFCFFLSLLCENSHYKLSINTIENHDMLYINYFKIQILAFKSQAYSLYISIQRSIIDNFKSFISIIKLRAWIVTSQLPSSHFSESGTFALSLRKFEKKIETSNLTYFV